MNVARCLEMFKLALSRYLKNIYIIAIGFFAVIIVSITMSYLSYSGLLNYLSYYFSQNFGQILGSEAIYVPELIVTIFFWFVFSLYNMIFVNLFLRENIDVSKLVISAIMFVLYTFLGVFFLATFSITISYLLKNVFIWLLIFLISSTLTFVVFSYFAIRHIGLYYLCDSLVPNLSELFKLDIINFIIYFVVSIIYVVFLAVLQIIYYVSSLIVISIPTLSLSQLVIPMIIIKATIIAIFSLVTPIFIVLMTYLIMEDKLNNETYNI